MGARRSQTLEIRLPKEFHGRQIPVWRTNRDKPFVKIDERKSADGVLAFPLEPDGVYSLTTTRGQRRGSAQGATPARFPFPFVSDFENTVPGRSPAFWSDIGGAFEVSPGGSAGSRQCLRQVIQRQPIFWAGCHTLPATIAGDREWRDYTVSADVLLEESGTAILLGRIRDKWGNGDWNAYQFHVSNQNGWVLKEGTKKVLATGTLTIAIKTWHRLALEFRGSEIRAFLDHQEVARVSDTVLDRGMIGLSLGQWINARFDNVMVASD
jgi:hypothetical protein